MTSFDTNGNTANLDFEQRLWIAGDKLWSNRDAAKHKRAGPEGFVLGLIFLRFAAQRAKMKNEYNVPDQINHH